MLNSLLFVDKLEFIFTAQILFCSALYSLISLICGNLMNLRSLAAYRSADSVIVKGRSLRERVRVRLIKIRSCKTSYLHVIMTLTIVRVGNVSGHCLIYSRVRVQGWMMMNNIMPSWMRRKEAASIELVRSLRSVHQSWQVNTLRRNLATFNLTNIIRLSAI